jgi:hypothetical protein
MLLVEWSLVGEPDGIMRKGLEDSMAARILCNQPFELHPRSKLSILTPIISKRKAEIIIALTWD